MRNVLKIRLSMLATATVLLMSSLGGCPDPAMVGDNSNDNGTQNDNSSGNANVNSNSSQRAAPRVEVDTTMRPQGTIAPYEDGTPRPIACATDKSKIPVDFVVNELIFTTSDPAELDAFVSRWNGTVLSTLDPSEHGLDGPISYLVRVETTPADHDAMDADLEMLNPNGAGDMVVSSQAAVDLIAAAAEEAATGAMVGINFLFTTDTLEDRTLTDGPTANQTLTGFNGITESYNPNPFMWSYMRGGNVQNFGIAESWRMLERAGKLGNRIRVGVIDGGFANNPDYPPVRAYANPFGGGNGTEPNPVNCSGGGGCPWHGTNVSDVIAARIDNSYGAAGVAGPIAELINVKMSAGTFENMAGVAAAFGGGARIINMSFGARVPATVTFTLIPFNSMTSGVRDRGALLFAAAGNSGANIDEEDCFIACWEEAWWTPAENAGVIAVGSLDLQSTFPRSDSNYGAEELDIWGPGFMWVGPDPGNNQVHRFGATSGASPFVAGVAALIWAGNPALNANDVERILYDTCNTGSSGAHRWPNAYRGVLAAIGGNTPPELSNVKAERVGFVGNTVSLTCVATDVEDGTPQVAWYSDRQGFLGNGTALPLGVPADIAYGRHVITCVAVDRGRAKVEKKINFEIANNPPRLSIEAPATGATYFAGQTAFFDAYTYDIESGAALPDAKVSWSSDRQGALGTGNSRQNILTVVGEHVITLTGTDADNATTRTTIRLTVNPAPPDGIPPTAFIHSLDYDAFQALIEPGTGFAYTEFTLIGSGVDPEDGILPGASLAWTLQSGGVTWNLPATQLGTFVRGRFYGSGNFTITLTATDSSGKTGTHRRTGTISRLR